MYKVLLFLVISVLFIGCTSKNSAFRYFEKSNIDSEIVQNTKNADIIENKEPKLLFWATYLNNIEKYKHLKNETFIINVYFTESKTQNIQENGYNLTLNNNEFISIKKLENTNENYKDLFLKNSWGQNYLVQFKSLEKRVYDLNLSLTSGYSKAQLKFEK